MIILTVDANTYVTLVEANAYFEAKYHNGTWNDADDDTKSSCLAWATRLLDQQNLIWIILKDTFNENI